MSKDVNPTEVLSALKTETLQDLFLHDHPDERGTKHKKKNIVNSLASSIESAGVKALISNLKRETLQAVLKGRESALKEGDNKNNKTLLGKRLKDLIDAEGIDDFLQKGDLSESVLRAMLEALDEESDAKKDALPGEIAAAVRRLGMEAYFSSFDVESLHDVCEDLNLKAAHTNNKRKLVECIINNEDAPKSSAPKKQKVQASKKKKPIEKGITFDDVFQHYYVDEVRDWCKEKGLKTTGKKTMLIRRILAYLDGDTETTMATPSSKGRGRKRKASAAASSKEEKGDKAANGKKSGKGAGRPAKKSKDENNSAEKKD